MRGSEGSGRPRPTAHSESIPASPTLWGSSREAPRPARAPACGLWVIRQKPHWGRPPFLPLEENQLLPCSLWSEPSAAPQNIPLCVLKSYKASGSRGRSSLGAGGGPGRTHLTSSRHWWPPMQPECQDPRPTPTPPPPGTHCLPVPCPSLSHTLPEKKGRCVFATPTAHKSTRASCCTDNGFPSLSQGPAQPSVTARSPPPQPVPRLRREPWGCRGAREEA